MVLATFQSLHYEMIPHHMLVKTKMSRVISSGIYHADFFPLSVQDYYSTGWNGVFSSHTLAPLEKLSSTRCMTQLLE